MLSRMLSEGLGVFTALPATVARRVETGIARDEFIRAMVVAALVSAGGILLPEINGVAQAIDRTMGDASSFSLLDTSGLVMLGWVMVVSTGLVIWQGPALAGRLARLCGGSDDLRAAALWIYVGTAASVVVTLAVAASDLVMGLLAASQPHLAGVISLVSASAGAIAVAAACAALARRLCGVPGNWRALLMTILWLVVLFGPALLTALPLASLFE